MPRDLLRSCTRTAWHLEMRDGYMPDDPKFTAWLAGVRYDPGQRETWWRPWLDIVAAAVKRGVEVRRARIVSEPISDYVRFEYDITFTNLAAGEQVRWLPRREATSIALPGNDFWLFDGENLLINHFSGNGDATGTELVDDPTTTKLCALAFEDVWRRAADHNRYHPS